MAARLAALSSIPVEPVLQGDILQELATQVRRMDLRAEARWYEPRGTWPTSNPQKEAKTASTSWNPSKKSWKSQIELQRGTVRAQGSPWRGHKREEVPGTCTWLSCRTSRT